MVTRLTNQVARPADASGSKATTSRLCPVCRVGRLSVFADLGDLPAQIGVQWASIESARACRRGRIRLAYCEACSFVTNVAFSSRAVDYDDLYDNDLSHSPRFREYEQGLIARLAEEHDLRGKRVVEIGCGNGGFLRRLCAAAGCQGIGFDPSLSHSTEKANSSVELVAEYYPDARGPLDADLIVCRQVFEHLPDPLSFLLDLRAGIRNGSNTVVCFEVPSFDYVLDELALWTLIYEHCSYFTSASLAAVFTHAGFDVRHVKSGFDGQFLTVEAIADGPPADGCARAEPGAMNTEFIERIESFVSRLDRTLAAWRSRIARLAAEGKRVAVWGAGARAVSFLNLVSATEAIRYVVDINPNKAGNYIAGCGQRIVEPAFLAGYRPDAIVVMNPIYLDEIRSCVASMSLQPDFLTV